MEAKNGHFVKILQKRLSHFTHHPSELKIDEGHLSWHPLFLCVALRPQRLCARPQKDCCRCHCRGRKALHSHVLGSAVGAATLVVQMATATATGIAGPAEAEPAPEGKDGIEQQQRIAQIDKRGDGEDDVADGADSR